MMLVLLTTIDLLEVELSSRAQEEEEKRRQKNANVALASFTSTGSGKGSNKPICRDFSHRTTAVPRVDSAHSNTQAL